MHPYIYLYQYIDELVNVKFHVPIKVVRGDQTVVSLSEVNGFLKRFVFREGHYGIPTHVIIIVERQLEEDSKESYKRKVGGLKIEVENLKQVEVIG